MYHEPVHTLDQLVILQENGNPMYQSITTQIVQISGELTTGQRTLPQDKSQRLYILGIRETRISGRMRLMSLVPTASSRFAHQANGFDPAIAFIEYWKGGVQERARPSSEVTGVSIDSVGRGIGLVHERDEEMMKKAESAKEKILITTVSELFGLVAVTSKLLRAAGSVFHNRKCHRPGLAI